MIAAILWGSLASGSLLYIAKFLIVFRKMRRGTLTVQEEEAFEHENAENHPVGEILWEVVEDHFSQGPHDRQLMES